MRVIHFGAVNERGADSRNFKIGIGENRRVTQNIFVEHFKRRIFFIGVNENDPAFVDGAQDDARHQCAAKIGGIEGVIIFFKLRENFLNLIHAVEDSIFGGAIQREHDAHPHRRVYQNQQRDKARRVAESYFRRNFKAAELSPKLFYYAHEIFSRADKK